MKTSEELHELHKELWGWLAETGKTNILWPKWKDDALMEFFPCFACHEKNIRTNGSGACDGCPLGNCDAWDMWHAAQVVGDTESSKKYAAIIRDLPWSQRPEAKP